MQIATLTKLLSNLGLQTREWCSNSLQHGANIGIRSDGMKFYAEVGTEASRDAVNGLAVAEKLQIG